MSFILFFTKMFGCVFVPVFIASSFLFVSFFVEWFLFIYLFIYSKKTMNIYICIYSPFFCSIITSTYVHFPNPTSIL